MSTRKPAGPGRRPFHVGLNAHLLSGRPGYRRAGIHHYIARLLSHLPETADLRYTVFTNNRTDWQAGVTTAVSPTRLPTEQRLVRIMWEQLLWPWQAGRQQLDLLHSLAFALPYVNSRPAAVTIYDLSFLHYPDRFPSLQRRYLTAQTQRACRLARRVITISESGRQDVHRLLQVPLEQIDIVYPGVSAQYRPRPAAEVAAFRQKKELPDRFILHVGTLQPRKNIPTLIKAFARLKQPDLSLVLVGGKGWQFDEIFDRIQALGLEKQVLFPGYVPDAELPLWYNAATMLVFPSIYEGFGLPVAEAMACGLPVISAKTSSLTEVAGEAALFFAPDDVAALANHMAIVLDDRQKAEMMATQGQEQAGKFNWEQSGQELTAVYRRIMTEL